MNHLNNHGEVIDSSSSQGKKSFGKWLLDFSQIQPNMILLKYPCDLTTLFLYTFNDTLLS
jgi:hypothetical protein